MRDEKRKLEQEIEKLKEQIETLQVQKSAADSLREVALQEGRLTISELKWHSELRGELRKYGIPVDDIPKFTKIVDNIKGYGYDAGKVISEFSDLKSLRLNHDFLRQS